VWMDLVFVGECGLGQGLSREDETRGKVAPRTREIMQVQVRTRSESQPLNAQNYDMRWRLNAC
jgi:hypothetical protein